MQESTETEEMTAEGAVAEETSSPEVTDGASSSDAAADEPKSLEDILSEGADEAEADDAAEEASQDFKAEHGSADEETGEAPDETVSAEQKSEETHEKDDGDDEFRLPDEEFKSLPDGARKRIGHLNARAKKAERQLQELNTELETARGDQQALGQLRQFAQENQMSQQDVAMALGAFAKYKTGDFKGFVADLRPLIDIAQQSAGEAFAPDLQEQVDNGYLTEQAARELTQARLEAKRHKEAAERATQVADQQRQQQEQAATLNQIVTAVNSREAEIRSSDPDYAQKAPAVKRFMEYAMKNGARPQSVEEAVRMVNDAYEQASAVAPKAPPKPTPTTRPPATTVPRGNPRPATLEDALAMAPPPGSAR